MTDQTKSISAVYQRSIKDPVSPGRRKVLQIGQELVVVSNERKAGNTQQYWFCLLAKDEPWISFDIRTLPQFSAEERTDWEERALTMTDAQRLDRVAQIVKANPSLIEQLIQVAEAAL